MALRLSIWEQFSSNHSSRFTVVGVFHSADEANRAADTIMAVRQATNDWLKSPENDELRERVENGGFAILPAAPPECEFAVKMGITWEYSRVNDWYFAIAFDDLLFIDGSESSMGARPMDEIVARLGGRVYTEGTTATTVEESTLPGKDTAQLYFEDAGPHTRLTTAVTCKAPSETVAAEIEREFAEYLTRSCSPDNPDTPEAIFNTPWQAYQEENFYSSVDGLLHRDGSKLSFVNLSFFDITGGFPAMIKYLRAKGCEDVRYEFVQTAR
jgi:hypothetical protein